MNYFPRLSYLYLKGILVISMFLVLNGVPNVHAANTGTNLIPNPRSQAFSGTHPLVAIIGVLNSHPFAITKISQAAQGFTHNLPAYRIPELPIPSVRPVVAVAFP